MKDTNWKTFRRVALVQIFLLIVGFACFFYLRTVAYLNGPPDSDTYAQTWSFQLFVGALYLLVVLFLSGVLILMEAGLYWLIVQAVRRRN